MTDATLTERHAVPGTLVVFMIGQTYMNLEATEVVEIRTLKSAPSYPDVIPKQKIIKLEKRTVGEDEVAFLVKAYLPDVVVVEASLMRENILADTTLEFKRRIVSECRRVLAEFRCNKDFDEDYGVYCVSGYRGDPEVYLSMYGDTMAALLKNENVPLDEEEVKATLASYLKYGKDDIAVVDWDGAFLFEPSGDFQGNIELFEIANLQLLRSRILADDLDQRLEKTLNLLRRPKKLPLIRSRDIRKVLKEIIEIRAQSILESETIEHNIKLIGDWYSARLYSLIARKFHLEAWATDIKQKLDMLEDVYTMATENFSISYRATIEFVILAGWFALLLLYIGEFLLLR